MAAHPLALYLIWVSKHFSTNGQKLLLPVGQQQWSGSKFYAEMESSLIEALYQIGMLTKIQISEFYANKAAPSHSRWIQLPMQQVWFELHSPDTIALGLFSVCASHCPQAEFTAPSSCSVQCLGADYVATLHKLSIKASRSIEFKHQENASLFKA